MLENKRSWRTKDPGEQKILENKRSWRTKDPGEHRVVVQNFVAKK
jgi:hypothetical protein